MYAGKDPLTGHRVQLRGQRRPEAPQDTKTHQDRYIAIDPVACALVQDTLDEMTAAMADVGATIPASACLFSNDPAHTRPQNPDWVTHRVGDLAGAAGIDLDIKRIRHYTASQMLAEGFDLGNTAARLGHRHAHLCGLADRDLATKENVAPVQRASTATSPPSTGLMRPAQGHDLH